MHIPDGFLSPSTCAGFYAAASPFWYAALRRVKKTLHAASIPLLSVFSAFSFVVMMFNLPLPGGTTGHAVGMGVAAIVLGPWASILAISLALFIQAVFFGDGGITAYGANCFNMAIVGSLVAYGTYRLAAHRASLDSPRRVLAAGLAGYAAINFSALCAAIEFGLQPLFFHDASGAPLYAPYPLSVSIPAMMTGHLTFAGLAELVVSSGVVAYLQRADPALLRFSAPDAPADSPARPAFSTPRKLWFALAVLAVLTPLGLLATGAAFGESTVLKRIWTAPIPGYTPALVPSASFGYILSALLGVALIALVFRLLPLSSTRAGFVEKTARSFLRAVEHSLNAEESAQAPGLLQRFDPRVKLAGIAALILAAVASRRLPALLAIFLFAVLLAALSRIPIRLLALRVWLAVLAFTGLIALPALVLTPGHVLYSLAPLPFAITRQGAEAAAFLLLRAETAATLSTLLILTTLWTHILHALRFFRLPATAAVLLGMAYRYIFLFLQTAREMFEAREARLVGRLPPRDRRRLAASSAGVLLAKSVSLGSEVYLAMQARGFRGDVRLLDDLAMSRADWLRLTAFVSLAAAALWFGR